MTPRTNPEWIGSSPDAMPPPRVKLRIWQAHDGRCGCGCGRKIAIGEAWQLDHVVALINGGENAESNLCPIIVAHHRIKTRNDVAAKARNYVRALAHAGVKRRKQLIPGSRGTPFRKRIDGTVERR